MTSLHLKKIHGAGNDFILASLPYSSEELLTTETIKKLCDRKRGIGADGLIIISQISGNHFRMFFFNNDGLPADMCGNGLRCAALFASKTFNCNSRIIEFTTDAGLLSTEIEDHNMVKIEIPLKENFKEISIDGVKAYSGNTGVPHVVIILESLDNIDIRTIGRKIRYDNLFAPSGTNVNFVSYVRESQEISNEKFKIRTYERGVEDETLACGTGTAASAVVLYKYFGIRPPLIFTTAGKDTLAIDFCLSSNDNGKIEKIFLKGPAIEVFSANIDIDTLMKG